METIISDAAALVISEEQGVFTTAVQCQLGLQFPMTHSNTYLQSSVFSPPSVFVHSLFQIHGQADTKFNAIVTGATHHCHSSRSLFTEGSSKCHRINMKRRITDHKYLRTIQQKYKKLSITHCAAKPK